MTGPSTYARLEVLRTFRNVRFFIFSLVFPLTMYLLFAAPNRDEDDFAEQRDLRAALLHGRA